MSTTSDVITPITSPKTPLATVEEPMSTSIYPKENHIAKSKLAFSTTVKLFVLLKQLLRPVKRYYR